ncbi:hypothetical protein K456DRAFT_1613035 [Colletotrichum gloeosporioides 23]|nr:hypothetical protein K456DRAFT_1613035 [Colletotrichum gloeosporioides 23]
MLQYGRPLRLSSIGCLEHFVMLVAVWCSLVSKFIRVNHGMGLSRRCDLSLEPGVRLDTRRRSTVLHIHSAFPGWRLRDFFP